MNGLSPNREETVDRLATLNLQEFLTSLGLVNLKEARLILSRLLQPLSRWFAEQLLEFDQEIELYGLQDATQRAIRKYIRQLDVIGHEHIPASGPLLVLSNHPGMADALALSASIRRPDLRIIAQEREFMHLLPEITQRIIYVPEQVEDRIRMLREAIHHLQDGGAVLTFPAGRLEPDPIVMHGALESLNQWSESILLFARKVPEMVVIPTVVGGVVTKTAMTHPLTRLRRMTGDQQRMGYTLQLMATVVLPSLWPVRPQILYGSPLSGHALIDADSMDRAMETLRATVRRMMENLKTGLTSRP